MKNFTWLLCFLSTSLFAQLQSPQEFLGYEVGSQFSRHADVVNYFTHVADQSDMVTYHTYGKTNEYRPLTYAIISTQENLNNIETIRQDNLKQIGMMPGSAAPQVAIVWLSYNVHGNEASSTEASMKTLYELITQKQDWLKNTVVIIDPCVNPDGRDRYANWYNQVKSTPYNTRQDATEHHEPWPGGRPNHYLFDLNRDWAWATQVESQQRLKVYNTWMPHVHVDFHEQGINEPYYFAPAAEPFHEVITDWQRDFQTQIGKNHAKYFDKEGWLFFTRERFDLLYPSYGDTYPTFMGAIGMTYEQAGHGRAGLAIQTDEGNVLTLKDRVAHHTTTGLSTVEIAAQNAKKLNDKFKQFFSTANTPSTSYVLKGTSDQLDALTALLDKHEIQYGYSTTSSVKGYHLQQQKQGSFNAKDALIVSAKQPKSAMVNVLFEQNAKLSTPITYDITAWSLPYAYGLETIVSKNAVSVKPNETRKEVTNVVNDSAVGYITSWGSMKDAQFLAALLQANIKVRFTEKPLNIANKNFGRGSLIITKSDNLKTKNYGKTINDLASKFGRELFASASSFATSGPDFGSPDVKLINKQRIAVLKGDETSSLNYGEIWHFFEQQLNYPTTNIDTEYFKRIDLNQYDVLVMPNGYYGNYLGEKGMEQLMEWIRNGGKVIALSGAVSTFAGQKGIDLKRKDAPKKDSTQTASLIPYAQREEESVKNYITGAIFKTKVDNTHPLGFGYNNDYYTLKLGSSAYSYLPNGYNVAYLEDGAKPVSGYAGDNALGNLGKTLVFGEERIGSGAIIYMVDNPLFRGFWENGKLFFVNAIFFANNNKFRI
ncbi:M14 family metallopeptidase [Gangjinia marincola]|uniref:M14 family metallopeptidase n=1 Tax=Gangjinia marincola TaxID=578463 RepID=A0ABN1MG88_9FLAO